MKTPQPKMKRDIPTCIPFNCRYRHCCTTSAGGVCKWKVRKLTKALQDIQKRATERSEWHIEFMARTVLENEQ